MNTERISTEAPHANLMAAPLPGQKLKNGEPAPATYPEAWDQQFAPLHEFEQSLGRQVVSHLEECQNEYLRQMNLSGDWGTITRLIIQHERLGMILHLRVLELGATCKSPEGQCADRECASTRCMVNRAEKHPRFLGFENYRDEFIFDFELPAEIEESVGAFRSSLSPVRELMELREEARLVPWKIFEGADTDLDELSEVKSLRKRLGKVTKAVSRYANIREDGTTDLHALDDPGSLSYELARINSSIETLHDALKRSIEHGSKTKDRFKSAYEQHEITLKTIAEIEEKLGEPLPGFIKSPALEEHVRQHGTYFYAVLKGPSRRRAILDRHERALALEASAREELDEKLSTLSNHARWGSGWPGGALKAPVKDRWAELTGIDGQELDTISL